MPLLAFKRNVKCRHPIVHDLRRYNFSVSAFWPSVMKRCCRHWIVYIVGDPIKVLCRKTSIDLVRNVCGYSHTSNVIEQLFSTFFMIVKKGFFPSRFPF